MEGLIGAVTLVSVDRLRPFVDNNLGVLFADADVVFFTGSVLGRHAKQVREKFGIPSVVFHRNYEKAYYKDTDFRFLTKKLHMIISDRQQKESWHEADISPVRTSFDLEKILSVYGYN